MSKHENENVVMAGLAVIGFASILFCWIPAKTAYDVKLDLAAGSEGQAYLVERRWWGIQRDVYHLEYRFTNYCSYGCWYYRKDGKWRSADGRYFSHWIQYDPPHVYRE
jgi:hypothetical protein